MKRRQFIQFSSVSLLTTVAVTWGKKNYAQKLPPTLTIQWLGHGCFLFTGDNQKVLVNPFLNVGCNAAYSLPRPKTDVVLISSQLLDEGSVDGFSTNIPILYQAGEFRIQNLNFRGVEMDHDREGGRRFGRNVAWFWQQGGIKILHLGGAAAPITIEQKILINRPDVLILPVGGGEKSYNAQEAKKAIDDLNPKIVIPCQYLTNAADSASCSLNKVDDFLSLIPENKTRILNSNVLALSGQNLPQNDYVVRVLTINN